MLTFKDPFKVTKDKQGYFNLNIKMKLKWPNQAECQISKKMRLLVESMLQIDPEKRPSGKDLIELTEHFVN